MSNFIKLTLSRTDAIEILEGLQEKLLIWMSTQQYIEAGYTDLSDMVEDCSNPEEAEVIVNYYDYLIKTIERHLNRNAASPQKNTIKIYITLAHGRMTPNEGMDEMGSVGPTFGPYLEVYVSYSIISLLRPNQSTSDVLYINNGLIYYDGIYYGDWIIGNELKPCQRIKPFEQKKTNLRGENSACTPQSDGYE